MQSVKRLTKSNELLRLVAAVVTAGLVETSNAAVIIVPGSGDPRQTLSARDPQPTARSFEPLRVGDPLDYAHWLSQGNASSVGGQESVLVQDPRRRPALYTSLDDIASDEQVPDAWHDELTKRRATIAQVIKSVGRIEVYNMHTATHRPLLGAVRGTGFVVAQGLLMTNRHVAMAFFNVENGEFKINYETREQAEVWVNFAGVRGDRFASNRFRIDKLVYATASESGPDVALLHFDDPDKKSPPPLPLQTSAPLLEVNGRQSVICGYPVGMDYSFFRLPGVKRVSPGYMKGLLPLQESSRLLLHHDSSTAGGNSGSPLVDLGSGLVFGLHFQGRDDEIGTSLNAAEPIWDLLALREVRDAIGADMPSGQPRPSRPGPKVRRPALLVNSDGVVNVSLDEALSNEFPPPYNIEALTKSARGVAFVNSGDSEVGTGFVVAPRVLLMPAFFVTRGAPLTATFGRTFDQREMPTFRLREISRFGDGPEGIVLAFLDGPAPVPDPLDLLSSGDFNVGDGIAVIGHHTFDSRVPDSVGLQVFRGPQFVKRVSPGLLLSPATEAIFGADLAHDASTLAGSSGSPIVALRRGGVVGIHIGGVPSTNYGFSFAMLFSRYPELQSLIEDMRRQAGS